MFSGYYEEHDEHNIREKFPLTLSNLLIHNFFALLGMWNAIHIILST